MRNRCNYTHVCLYAVRRGSVGRRVCCRVAEWAPWLAPGSKTLLTALLPVPLSGGILSQDLQLW
jgi:hypothetical protein